MKTPMGFGGSGIWAIVLLLVGGVIWIRHDFGPNMAGAAVLALFGVLVFLAGQMTNIASRQMEGNQRVAELQATSRIEQERIKGENTLAKVDAQSRLKELIFLLGLIKQLLNRHEDALPAPEDEDVIDLDAIRLQQWSEEDL